MSVEKSIRKVEKKIDGLTLDQMMDSLTDEDISDNSSLAKRMLGFPDVDAPFRRFINVLGAWEIGIGESLRSVQAEMDQSLQLLQVLTGAEDKITMLKFAARLKKVERRIPGMVKQLATSLYGGAYANQLFPQMAGVMPPTATDPPPAPSPQPSLFTYEWTDAAKAAGGPAPVALCAAVLNAGKVERGVQSHNAIGVVVSVDTTAKTATVAPNGQIISGLTAAQLTGLNAGDDLMASPNQISGRWLITIAEAATIPIAAGSPIKIIARVLQNTADSRAIVVVDQSIRPMPI